MPGHTDRARDLPGDSHVCRDRSHTASARQVVAARISPRKIASRVSEQLIAQPHHVVVTKGGKTSCAATR